MGKNRNNNSQQRNQVKQHRPKSSAQAKSTIPTPPDSSPKSVTVPLPGDPPPSSPVVPPPNEEKTRIEIRKMKREMKKIAAEMKDLEWQNSPRTRWGLTKVSEWTSIITAIVAVGSMIAVFATGYVNAARTLNQNEFALVKLERAKYEADIANLADQQKDYERKLAKLASDTKQAETVLFPKKLEIEGRSELKALIEKGLDVRIYQGLGLGQTEVLITVRGNPIEAEDVENAFRAIAKLPNVLSIEAVSLPITDKVLKALPLDFRSLTLRFCKLNIDLGNVSPNAQLFEIDFENCTGNVVASRAVPDLRWLTITNTPTALKLLEGKKENLPLLYAIELRGEDITDEVVKRATENTQIERLVVRGAKITPKVIDTAKSIASLKFLSVDEKISTYKEIEGSDLIVVNEISPIMKNPSLYRFMSPRDTMPLPLKSRLPAGPKK